MPLERRTLRTNENARMQSHAGVDIQNDYIFLLSMYTRQVFSLMKNRTLVSRHQLDGVA